MACNNSGRAEGIFHAHTGAHHMPNVYRGGTSYVHTGTSYMPSVYARQRGTQYIQGNIMCGVAHGIYHSLFIGSQFIQGDIVYEV